MNGPNSANSLLQDVLIVGAARTPVGSFRSALASKSATSLGAIAIKGVLEKTKVAPDQVQEVILGNVLTAGLGQAPAKQAAMEAGLPESTICSTVNKVCASGMKAFMNGVQSIALGQNNTVVTGGMESMSNAPYLLEKARAGFGYGHQQVIDSVLKDGLWDAHYQIHMGDCAEETAIKYDIGREEQDAFAIQSYKRAAEAVQSGKFHEEMVPVPIQSKSGVNMIVEDEEYKKVDFTKVPKLKPAFKPENGTVTAANASTLNDGASALLLMHKDKASSLGVKPLARILSIADAECNPKLFTIAPSLAIPKALERAGVSLQDVALFEINEAFSVVALANQKILGLDPAKVNVLGGAVALGHPIGSSGARIIVSLVHALKPGQIGCAAVCNGGGGASAIVIKKL